MTTVVTKKVDDVQQTNMPDWYALLVEAVKEPGKLSAAHKYFHQYSLANRWLAAVQLAAAGRELQPINTFKGWLALNRVVQKGQKASIALIMPVPVKSKKKGEPGEEPGEVKFTRFMLRNFWFYMDQTEGEDLESAAKERPDWSIPAAMAFLEIIEKPFAFFSINDTVREGYARGKTIAVSPVHATLDQDLIRIREMSRIVLGHTADTPAKSVPEEADVRDLEAETTAYLVAASMGLEGLEASRARIQASLAESAKVRIPSKSAHRAFSAADKILNAGYC